MPDGFQEWLMNLSHGINEWRDNITNGWTDFWNGTGEYLGDLAQNFGEHMEQNTYGLTGVGRDNSMTPSPDTQPGNDNFVGSSIDNALDGGASLSQYIQENPGLTPEQYFEYMSKNSDEWAEKWLDYSLEKQSIDDQNAYTASREDTAYQRLVQDLKAAGMNPAMMYGSSASPQASGSVGVVKASEGANSRTIGNYEKIKKLIVYYMLYRLKGLDMSANMTTNFMGSILKMLI